MDTGNAEDTLFWRTSRTGRYHVVNPLHPFESFCTAYGLDRPIRLIGPETANPLGQRCQRCLTLLT
ncbi:MAG: hypothetical protein M1596_04080 [Firmicutes bacterium]|jgi:hypothetical protein|nr:hypothetical protein [Bacillota bacterium]